MAEKQSKFNRIDNLKGNGWKPGQSGNPKGRPKKGLAIADILNSKGDEVMSDGRSRREKMLELVYGLATKAKPERWAVEFISDRTEGKSLERVEQKITKDEVIIE